MQLITLTAPDGHRERWEPCLAANALKQLYRYLINPDQATVSKLAQQVEEFVGNDPERVRNSLVYAQSVQDGLFHKLALISNNGERSMTRIFFLLRSLDKDTGIHRNIYDRPADDNPMIAVIQQVTNRDQRTIKGLAALAKLFVDGQLSYDSLGMSDNEQVTECN